MLRVRWLTNLRDTHNRYVVHAKRCLFAVYRNGGTSSSSAVTWINVNRVSSKRTGPNEAAAPVKGLTHTEREAETENYESLSYHGDGTRKYRSRVVPPNIGNLLNIDSRSHIISEVSVYDRTKCPRRTQRDI